MYSFSYLEPVCCFMCISNYCFLTCIQISQEAGQVVWYSHLFQNFLQFIVIHTVKGFGIVNKPEIDVFFPGTFLLFSWSSGCSQFDFCFLCLFFFFLLLFFFYFTLQYCLVLKYINFSKTSLNIWKFTIYVLFKPGLENLSITLLACEMHAVVWAFFGIGFLWDWNENWSFTVLWPLLSFPNLLAYWVQHFHSIIF